MNKTKPVKFTFKNGDRSTGLAAVGEGTPSIGVRFAGVDVGAIHFNDHLNSNRDLGIQVCLMVPREVTPDCSCKWRWFTLKRTFTSADDAKEFLNSHFKEISKMVYVEEGDR